MLYTYFTIAKHFVNEINIKRTHLYIIQKKLGFTGVCIIFLMLLKKIDCGYSWERLAETVLTSTNKLCFEKKYESYQKFYLYIFLFWLWNFPYIWIGMFSSCIRISNTHATMAFILVHGYICLCYLYMPHVYVHLPGVAKHISCSLFLMQPTFTFGSCHLWCRIKNMPVGLI